MGKPGQCGHHPGHHDPAVVDPLEHTDHHHGCHGNQEPHWEEHKTWLSVGNEPERHHRNDNRDQDELG